MRKGRILTETILLSILIIDRWAPLIESVVSVFRAFCGLGDPRGWYCHRPHHHVIHEDSGAPQVTELGAGTVELESPDTVC